MKWFCRRHRGCRHTWHWFVVENEGHVRHVRESEIFVRYCITCMRRERYVKRAGVNVGFIGEELITYVNEERPLWSGSMLTRTYRKDISWKKGMQLKKDYDAEMEQEEELQLRILEVHEAWEEMDD